MSMLQDIVSVVKKQPLEDRDKLELLIEIVYALEWDLTPTMDIPPSPIFEKQTREACMELLRG